jgi:hypothetical protein
VLQLRLDFSLSGMVDWHKWTAIAQWLNVSLFVAVAVRLRWLHLHRKYPVFFWYVSVSACRSAALMAFDFRSATYFWIWLLSEPLNWVLNVLLVRELFSLVLRQHRGIGRLSRWLFYCALIAGVTVSGISLLAEGSELPGQSMWLLAVFLVTRCVAITVVVFLLALVAFLNWYPVNLSHNVVRHSVVFAVYFLCITMGYLVRVVTGNDLIAPINVVLVALSAVCAGTWLTLTREGEERQIMLRSKWSHADERVMLGHLDALNSQLLRTSRKQA